MFSTSATNSPLRTPRRIFLKNVPIDSCVAAENECNANLDKLWRDKAEKELGETEDIVNARIKLLRNLMSVSHSLLRGRIDDAFLLRFLRAKKFDVDKALRMIQKYYSMKKHFPELFKVSPPSELQSLLELQIQHMIPLRDANGRQVYIFRVEKCDPSKCPVESVFRSNVLSLENAVRDPKTQIAGVVVLLDMSGLGLGHARFLSPHLAKRTVEVIQEAFPLRFKAFHILHEPFYFDAILTVLKPFLKEKIRRRIHLHGSSLSSVHRHISKDILPKEYGGTQPPFDNTSWRTQILNDDEYFMNLEKYIRSCDDESPSNGTPTHSLSDADGASSINYDTETEDSENDDDCFYACGDLDEDPLKTPCIEDNMMEEHFRKTVNGYCDEEKDVEEIK